MRKRDRERERKRGNPLVRAEEMNGRAAGTEQLEIVGDSCLHCAVKDLGVKKKCLRFIVKFTFFSPSANLLFYYLFKIHKMMYACSLDCTVWNRSIVDDLQPTPVTLQQIHKLTEKREQTQR